MVTTVPPWWGRGAEESLTEKVKKMVSSMDVISPLSLAMAVIAQSIHEQSGQCGKNRKCSGADINFPSLHLAWS